MQSRCLIWVMALAFAFHPFSAFRAQAASGSWVNAGGGNWSVTNNWAGGVLADGAGNTAWFTNALPGSRAVTNDVISRTVGIINLGAGGGLGSFSIAANSGLKLTLNNSGASAQVNQNSGSKGDTISSPLALIDSLDLANDSATKVLTLSGAITSAVANARTISNIGTGAGGVLISGPIGNGAGAVRVIQDSASSPLTLGGASTFTNGLVVKAGTVIAITSPNAFGANTNVITLGDSTGSQDTLLTCVGSLTFVQPIVVAGGNSGMASISNAGTSYFNGLVTLNNHALTIFSSASSMVVGGGISGTGTLLIATSGGSSGVNITTLPVNHVGSITNCGVGPSAGLLSGGVGSNVTAIAQASTNSQLSITGMLTVNAGGTTLANDNPSGAARLTVSGGVRGAGDLILKNNGAIPGGITILTAAVTNVGKVVNSGSGTGSTLISSVIGTNGTGVIQDSASSALVLSGANIYPGGTVIAAGVLMVSNATGFATGTGAVNINNGGVLQGVGAIGGTVTNRHGGLLSPGFDGTEGGTLTMGSLAWNGGGAIVFEVGAIANNESGAGIDYDQIVVTNALTAVPGGSNLVIRLDSLGQTLAFETNRNYSLKLITCSKSATLNPADVTLETNDFLAGGTWVVTNLNNAIYVICLGNASPNKNYWRGTGNWSTATNWSLGHAPLPGEDVEFDLIGSANCSADSVSNDLGSVTLAAGYTGTVTVLTKYPGQGAFTNLSIAGDLAVNGGVLTHLNNAATEVNRLMMTVGAGLTVGFGGRISADAKGYSANNGPGKSAGQTPGSYGGRGGGLIPGLTYGSVTNPVNLGSGGGSSSFSGGGAICLNVAGTATINGVISAKGGGTDWGPGSGGSVFLTAGMLAGTGTVSVSGGYGVNYGIGTGGGGRLALILTGSTDFGNVQLQAYPGPGTVPYGACGTIYKEHTGHLPGRGILIVDNNDVVVAYPVINTTLQNGRDPSSYAFSEIILTNAGVLCLDTNDVLDLTGAVIRGDPTDRREGLYLQGGALVLPEAFSGFSEYFIGIGGPNSTFAPSNSLAVGTNATIKIDVPWTATVPFTLEGGGWMSHSQNTTNEAYKINLTVNGNLDIKANAQINVDGMGYNANSGPGKPGQYQSAGGYGGVGGNFTFAGGTTYGSLTAPTNIGSGGNTYQGGGCVQLRVTGTTIVNGVISANGAGDNNSSGGSGGSIFLTTGSVAGNGPLRASTLPAVNNYSSGGGGRIAVILTNSTSFADLTFQAIAGTSPSGIGGAGTIYLETAAQGAGKGLLLVDASNRVTATAAYTGTTLIGSNVTDAFVGTVILTNKATLVVNTNQALTVNGSWTNSGAFLARTNSTVAFAGDSAVTIAGSNAFYNLAITNAGKIVSFQAGRTNLVAGLLKLGSTVPGTTVTLQSTVDGSWWYLNLTTAAGGTQQIARVSVKDSNADGGQLLQAARGSVDGGHNVNWLFPSMSGTVIVVR